MAPRPGFRRKSAGALRPISTDRAAPGALTQICWRSPLKPGKRPDKRAAKNTAQPASSTHGYANPRDDRAGDRLFPAGAFPARVLHRPDRDDPPDRGQLLVLGDHRPEVHLLPAGPAGGGDLRPRLLVGRAA